MPPPLAYEDIVDFLKEIGPPRPLFVYFRSFQAQIFTENTVADGGIRTRSSNKCTPPVPINKLKISLKIICKWKLTKFP